MEEGERRWREPSVQTIGVEVSISIDTVHGGLLTLLTYLSIHTFQTTHLPHSPLSLHCHFICKFAEFNFFVVP